MTKFVSSFALAALAAINFSAATSSAATIYCLAMQKTTTSSDATPVVRKAVDINPVQGPVTIATVEGTQYKVDVEPWGELELTIAPPNAPSNFSVGSLTAPVTSVIFSAAGTLTHSFICSANYDAATAYHIDRCPQVTADCQNN